MIQLETWVQDDCTLGRLSVGDFRCFTLELPWKNNERSVSCIPAGTYTMSKYHSPTKGWVFLLHGVPDRTYIEIHAGNYTRQIEGCILVGDGIKYLDDDGIPDVTNSKATLSKLLAMMPEHSTIKIARYPSIGPLYERAAHG